MIRKALYAAALLALAVARTRLPTIRVAIPSALKTAKPAPSAALDPSRTARQAPSFTQISPAHSPAPASRFPSINVGTPRYCSYGAVVTPPACPATTIGPVINGAQSSSATVASGASVAFSPTPTSGGSWSWSGCGTTGTSRTQTVFPTASCSATARYTNSCGTVSTQVHTITVTSTPPLPGHDDYRRDQRNADCQRHDQLGRAGSLRPAAFLGWHLVLEWLRHIGHFANADSVPDCVLHGDGDAHQQLRNAVDPGSHHHGEFNTAAAVRHSDRLRSLDHGRRWWRHRDREHRCADQRGAVRPRECEHADHHPRERAPSITATPPRRRGSCDTTATEIQFKGVSNVTLDRRWQQRRAGPDRRSRPQLVQHHHPQSAHQERQEERLTDLQWR